MQFMMRWPGGEDAIGFSKSTDGGVTWSSARIYSAVNFGIRGNLQPTSNQSCLHSPSMAVDRSGGTNNGTIYIMLAADKRSARRK